MDTKEVKRVVEIIRDWNAGMGTAEIARKHGYKNVGSFRGAIAAWRKKGIKIEKRSGMHGLGKDEVNAINKELSK